MNALARRLRLIVPALLAPALAVPVMAEEPPPPTMASVLEASRPADWMPLDQAKALYVALPGGRVVIRLAPEFAPEHVANIETLVRQRYFDGLAIVRSQENYVVQWGDPAEAEADQRPLGAAKRTLPAEFERALGDDLSVAPLPDGDVYAERVGFADGFPAALDPGRGRIWLTHCHGMLGVARDVDPVSGSGTQLYVVIGHSPRHLDRNVTLVGRVVQGMEVLSTLPRGTGALGFYESAAERTVIESIRLGSELPPAERARLELLRTDTPTFERLIAARRHRRESWFVEPTGRISLCNVPLPVRAAGPGSD